MRGQGARRAIAGRTASSLSFASSDSAAVLWLCSYVMISTMDSVTASTDNTGDNMCDEKQNTTLHLNSDQDNWYEEYDRPCEERRAENDGYLDEFEAWLEAAGLSDKTIQRHMRNVDFFINTYLLREDAYGIEEGCLRMDDFLGYFFIRKCMWSTPKTIKQNATSFKKFYKCMLEKGHITPQSYDILLDDIKTNMPMWLEDCEDFNNPTDDEYDDLLGPGGKGLFDALYGEIARAIGIDDQLGVGHELPLEDYEGEYEDDLPTREEMIRELTLVLLYLTSREEKDEGGSVYRARKSADSDTLNWLREKNLISCTDKEESVDLTDGGMKMAELTLFSLGLEHLTEKTDETDEDNKGSRTDLRLV